MSDLDFAGRYARALARLADHEAKAAESEWQMLESRREVSALKARVADLEAALLESADYDSGAPWTPGDQVPCWGGAPCCIMGNPSSLCVSNRKLLGIPEPSGGGE
jgi:hypothetical protein